MKKIFFPFLLFFLLFCSVIYGQFSFNKEDVIKRLNTDIAVLASDSLQGRLSGTTDEIKARDYIIEKFKEAGLKPAVGDTSFEQKFYIKNLMQYSYNVCGFLDNHAPHTVVIGAHYDHVGLGDFGSRSKGGHIHHGADDNASGTATVIELARRLSQTDSLRYNYLFVAFSAEEVGLYGSKHFTESNLMAKPDVRYMLNFDMVGRFNYDGKKRLIVYGSRTSPAWQKVLKRAHPKTPRIKKVPYGPGFSDHFAFYNQKVPLLYFTTGLPEEYHTPFDTYETIDFDGMYYIIEYVNKLIVEAEKASEVPFKECTGWQVFRSYMFSGTMML